MPKKKARSRKPSKTSKKQTRTSFVLAAMVVGVLAIGVGFMMFGGGKVGEIPPAKTSDSKVVVIEFFDYG